MSELLFYEDVPVGLSFDTEGIAITESHVVQFAGLSGDFFALHMDDNRCQAAERSSGAR